MCRNAKIPTKAKLKVFLGESFEIPEYEDIENANSFDHPDVPIITNIEPDRITLASWGLIPEWVKDFDAARRMADACRNARSEDIFDKPSYAPYILKKRCLILIEGFYEHQWNDPKGKKKTEFYITTKDESMFAAGGIWTEWYDPELKQKIKTCTIITTASNPLMSEIHNSKLRQPFLLEKDKWAQWLNIDLSKEEVVSLMAIHPDTNMKAIKVEKQKKEDKPDQGSLF